MKNSETSRRISQQFCAFASTQTDISEELELKLKKLVEWQEGSSSQTPVTGKKLKDSMNEAELKKKIKTCVKRLSVPMEMLYNFTV